MRTRKNELDKFYTKPILASQLISLLELSEYDTIIEPSAGSGSFSKQISGSIAIDLQPEDPSIIKADFLKWKPVSNTKEKTLVIGNPPFGQQCSLAIKFIKHAATFASTIAFILPKSFKKESIQSKIPLDFHLVTEMEVPDNSFTLNGVDYSVPCEFQVWKQRDYKRSQIKEPKLPADISWTRDTKIANIAVRRVGVYAGKAFSEITNKSVQSHYFLVVPEDKKVHVLNALNNAIWQHNNTTGPRSISKKEFAYILNKI